MNSAIPRRDATLSPETRAFLEAGDRDPDPLVIHATRPEELDTVRSRVERDVAGALGPPAQMAAIVRSTVPTRYGSIDARIYIPHDATRRPPIFFVHGGGWVICSIDTHDRHYRYLAQFSRRITVALEYSLSPEHPFPRPLHEITDAIEYMSRNADEFALSEGPVIVASDSAGGNLAAAAALVARDRKELPIAGHILLYPALDISRMDTESYAFFSEGYGLTAADMAWFAEQYVPDPAMRSDPLVSPLVASDLSGVVPTVLVVAGNDVLRDDGLAYAQRLRTAGVDVALLTYHDQIHGFLNYDGVIPAAVGAFEAIAGEATRLIRA